MRAFLPLVVILILACSFGACRNASSNEGTQGKGQATVDAESAASPTERQDKDSSGSTIKKLDGISNFSPLDQAFVADREHFTPKLPPRPGDWLDRFPQTGITFDEYIKVNPLRPTPERGRIVLQPLGDFSKDQRALLDLLGEFMAAFFDLPTTVASAAAVPTEGTRWRRDGGRRWQQLSTGVILRDVLPELLPADAVCVLGVTMSDLYPDPSWNYVFGQATLRDRVGVYSLARYFPEFWGQPRTDAARKLAVLRSFKVLSHEAGHMFSLEHCTRYECNMNGSNSLEEMDRAPAYLCSECLKMLQWNLRFDLRERYSRLRDLHRRAGLEPQAAWINSRLEKIGSGVP